MSRPRKIAVVTGSRAEYGLLYWVLQDLQQAKDFELQLIVTGMHLAPEFDMTVKVIEQDGLPIARKVEMLLSGDSAGSVAKSMALGLIGFSDALEQLAPDVLLVLGDRFEIFAAAQAAMLHNIPIAHIAGGDTTEGAFDEAIRHAISKMSHLHLVTHEQSAQRVRQMGENPAHIHVVGNPGLDNLHRLKLLDKPALEAALGAPLGTKNLLITFHPVTLEPGEERRQQQELLKALAQLPSDTHCWFTLPNADSGGRALAADLRQWAAGRANAHIFASLGQLRYLSLMALADMVIGNSSSGLYEAPSFKKPTVNIGDRQRGRLAAISVIHCEPSAASIKAALSRGWTLDCSAVVNPYGDGHSTSRIMQALRELPISAELLKKRFHAII